MTLKETDEIPADERKNGDVTPASLEGQTLGKYRVMEPLGRGGMARVYRAYHPQLDRYVAVKVLRSDLVDDEEFLTRFRREARAVAALRHPNIVQVFDSDVEGEIYYIVLELLEGDTLKTRLNDYRIRGERMPLGEMVRILLDVLDGLDYAHGEGMVHRDIKPANILLTGHGEAVVTDFGIAQMVGSTRHTASGAMMGTLNYMAPEQGLQGRSDVRSDVYSLGIVFYEMLTQRVPFDADTPLAVLMKHLNDPLPLPRKIEPAVPEPLERVVLKALAKQPDDRYQSAGEMAEALVAAAKEAGVEIPDRISLPLSFTTAEAPAESVAVFSGAARERITDRHFAEDDTDAALGKKLAAAGAEAGRSLGVAGKELWGALGAAAHVALTKTTEALRDATDAIEGARRGGPPPVPPSLPASPEPPVQEVAPEEGAQAGDEEIEKVEGQRLVAGDAARRLEKKQWKELGRQGRQKRREPRSKRNGVGVTVLGAIGLILAGNSCMLTLAAPLNFWAIYEDGWPIELFLVCLGLFGIMYATSSIWLLIPAGIVLGNGLIFAYCALTQNWDHWLFLWIFELWIVIGSVWVPIWLARNENLARGVSRLVALTGGLLSIGAIAVIGVVVGVGELLANLTMAFGL
jgi:tRNA A-37 threonylcarbamoyl transferase component Bud32